jgi:hypothetical protein
MVSERIEGLIPVWEEGILRARFPSGDNFLIIYHLKTQPGDVRNHLFGWKLCILDIKRVLRDSFTDTINSQ